MQTQPHYKFKMLMKCKMKRPDGCLIECTEEDTSKIYSSCGEIKGDHGGSTTDHCSNCYAVYDCDVNAATDILHMNLQMLS